MRYSDHIPHVPTPSAATLDRQLRQSVGSNRAFAAWPSSVNALLGALSTACFSSVFLHTIRRVFLGNDRLKSCMSFTCTAGTSRLCMMPVTCTNTVESWRRGEGRSGVVAHRDVLEADAEDQSTGLQLLRESLHGLFLASSTQRALHLH